MIPHARRNTRSARILKLSRKKGQHQSLFYNDCLATNKFPSA